MSLIFTVPKNSKGIVFVNVDGLGNKKLGESGGSLIAKDIHEARGIMAIYNGTEFIKQKFSTIHVEPVVVEEEPELPEIIEDNTPPVPETVTPEVTPFGIWADDYTGNPDDPANTTSPNALDSRNRPIFAKTITVGNSAMYKTLPEAIAALINDYGARGGGQLFAIEIDSSYTPVGLVFIGSNSSYDLRWITIFSKNNTILNFNSAYFEIGYTYAPIFNCTMSFDKTKQTVPLKAPLTIVGADHNSRTITFGKNTHIVYKLTSPGYPFLNRASYPVCPISIEAKYGFRFESTARLLGGNNFNLLINKGIFAFTTATYGITMNFVQIEEGTAKIYNTIFNIKGLNPKNSNMHSLLRVYNSKVYLRNVKSTDRIDGVAAVSLERNGEAILENCNFASQTNGEQGSGADIYIADSTTKTHLKNTTGNLNYPEKNYKSMGITRE
jgi:hypothetical protein